MLRYYYRLQRALLLHLCLHGGGPPPRLRLWGVTSPRFASEYRCYLTATLGRQKHLEGSLTSSVHTGGLHEADVFPQLPAHPLASVAWIQDVEVISYMYVFAPDYTTAQRGTSAAPCRSGSGDMSILGPFFLRPGLVPTDSPGSGFPDVSFLYLCYIYVDADVLFSLDARKPSLMPVSSPPANCSGWDL